MPDGSDAPVRGLPALDVVVAPEPFRPRVEHRTAAAGLTVAEILLEACLAGALDPQDLERTEVYIDGERIEARESVAWLRPRPGAVINVAVQVHGGGRGGSKALQTVLQVAIMAAAFAVAGPAGAFVGNAVGFAGGAGSAAAFAAGQAIGSIAAVSAVGLAGSALGQALFAGKKDSSSGQIYSLETQSNQARLREPMPLMLGQQRFAFDLASSAYTTFDGDDMWLTAIYGVHYGACQVSDLRIGETPIGAYAAGDVQLEQFLTPGPRNSLLYPTDIHQQSFENTLDREHGDTALATTVDGATTFELDFVWAGGLYYPKSDGRTVTSDTAIYVEISPYSQNAWQPAPGLPAGKDKSGNHLPAGAYYVQASQKDPLRKTLKVTLPRAGKWDVRLHRNTRPIDDTNNDTVTWTALRTPLPGKPILDETLAVIVVKLKAAQDLSGSAGVISGLVTPIVPIPGPARDWSVTAPSSNAAALTRWLLTGPAAAVPLEADEIDASCADQYDLIEANTWDASVRIAEAATQQDALNKLAAAGRSLIYWSGSALCFVPDWTKPGARQMFVGRNATDYRRKRLYPDPVHAVWVQFTNAGEDWKPDGLYVYADGYDATNAALVETLALDFGCLPDRAHREGRVWLARRFDQVWSHEFTAGADAATASYGARIRARRTSGLYGQTDARVRYRHWSGGLVAGVRLDDAVLMQAGSSYALDVRSDDVFLDGLALSTTPGVSRDVWFGAPLDPDLAPQKDDLVAFGTVGHVTEELEITDVDPQSDRSVRITARNYIGPALVAAETGPIPPLSTFLSTRVAAPQPVIVAVQGSPDGVIVAFKVDPQRTATLKGFVARWRVKPEDADGQASWSTLPLLGPTANQVVTPPIPGAQHQPDDTDAQVIVQVELWSVLNTGEASPATDVEVIVVQGVPPVTGFGAVGAVRAAADGSSYPVLQITADAITSGAVQDLVVEVQPHGANPQAWVSAGHSLPAANPNGDYPGVTAGADLDVRARWRDVNGWGGAWSTGEATIPSGALVAANTAKVGDLTAEQVAAQIAAADAVAAAAQQGVADNHAALVQAQADVQTAFGEISQEVLDRAAADASVQTQVTTNAQTIGGVSSSLSQEKTTRLTADTALGVRIDTNTSSIGTNSASITQESVTRAANDGALSGRIDTQNSQYGQLSSNLTQEAVTRAAADSALAATQSVLSAQLATGANMLSNPSFGQGPASWSISAGSPTPGDPQDGPYLVDGPGAAGTLPTGQVILAQQTGSANAGVTYSLQGRPYLGFIGAPTTFARVRVAWLNASGAPIVDYDGPQSNVRQGWVTLKRDAANGGVLVAPAGTVGYAVMLDIASSSGGLVVSGDNVAFGRIKLEVGQYCTAFSDDQLPASVTASITQEAVTRAAQDSALAATDTTLSAQIGTNASNLTQEAVTRAAQDSTLSGLYTNLNSQVGTNASNITQEAITRAAADGATTTTTNQLTATTGGLTATVGSQGAAISILQGLLQAYLRLYVAANGNAAAVELIAGNDGSLARLVATAITLSTQSGGQRIDVLKLIGTVAYFAGPVFVGTNMRLDPSVPGLIIDNGSAAIVLGNSFGANGDLFFWAGPSMATSSMTKANARMYFGTDATAFFGGAIRAGALSNSVQGTSIDPAATTTLGPFGTNGGAITVPWSYSYTRVGSRSGRQTVSGAPSATITLYRTITGQAEQQVSQFNVAGQSSAESDGENQKTDFAESMSGSATFSDNVGGTQNRTYRIAISNRVVSTFGGATYNNQADGVTQTLSITSSEG